MIDKNGHAADSPSPYATASLEADKRAFAAFMRHLKAADPQHTVIMVQVENEAGTWGSVRDYSPAAQKLFEGPCPPEVVSAMHIPSAANWQGVFGTEAEVCFHAWSVAKYVGQVAAAGKAVYPLPCMPTPRCATPQTGRPGQLRKRRAHGQCHSHLESRGAGAGYRSARHLHGDSVAYLKVLDLYHRDDNPLFVPETGDAGYARFFFCALGLQAIGYSPFGMDYTGNRRSWGRRTTKKP